MITNGKPQNDPNVLTSFSDLAHDVIELAELQAQLLKLDAIASGKTLRTAVVFLLSSVCLLLGCLPILWLTIAEVLVEYAGWKRTPSLAVAFACGLLIAGGLGAWGWRRLSTMFSSFERSREEFVRNLNWVKSNLTRPPVPSRRERRPEVPLPK
jgi:hypothetical protein